MARARRRIAWALALGAALAPPGAAQQPSPVAPAPAAPQAPGPPQPAPAAAIPVPEVAARAEETAVFLRSIDAGLEPNAALASAEQGIDEIAERNTERFSDTEKTLEQGPQLRVVDQLARSWQPVREDLAARGTALTTEAKRLEDVIADLGRRRELWTRTRDDARAANAPPLVLDRVSEVLAALGSTQKSVEKRRAEILGTLDQVTRELATADGTLTAIAAYREKIVANVLLQDAKPIWALDLGTSGRVHAASRIAKEIGRDWRDIQDFAQTHRDTLAFQGFLAVLLAFLFRRARGRARRMVEQEPALAPAARVFQLPYSAAIVLALLASDWIHDGLPDGWRQLVAFGALVPALRILRAYMTPALVPALYALAGFFVVDRIRFVSSSAPLLEQVIALAEMLAASLLMAWVVRPRPVSGLELDADDAWRLRAIRTTARVLLVAFVVAFVAGACGYMQLARRIGGGSLLVVYAAIVLYAAVRAAEGLVAYALRTGPVRRLRVVDLHRPALEHRIERGIVWVALAVGVATALRAFELLDPALALVQAVLRADLAWGEANFTVGDALAFVVTIGAAFLVSKCVRFVLQEEVYPRIGLTRGVPYAISSVLHYLLLFAGFLIALSATGLDLNRFTVLAGAFGVGIGFGLQNVVNNFVSGLILLLERPIQLGDTVQIAELQGQVTRIGIRSSTLRTFQGAEVIVPNATLISDRVTNWTFSDPMRRIDLPVGVAYGTDPEKMIALLLEIAQAHPNVLALPQPTALFQGFGASSLDFELRAWTSQPDGWVQVKSELGIAIYRRLQDEGIEIPFPQQDLNVRSLPKP